MRRWWWIAAIGAAMSAAAWPCAAAVDGKTHAVIAPAFTGADGNLSFVRFLNTSATAASTFTVTIVGTPTGREYGSTTYNVPARASPQHSFNNILAQANAGSLTGGDTGYSIYLRNPSIDSGFQHVIFNGANQFFENLSACQFFQGTQYLRVVGWLPNVHTTRLAAFPMRLFVHNFNNVGGNFRITAFDAVTGGKINDTVVTVAANETLTMLVSALETALNFTPTASQLHLNILVEAADGGTSNAVATAAVFNSTLNALIGMSTVCKLRP
ncbi:MAG: hypothetical protein SFV21_11435 [Rhodospirillaceae bacterium]|nr:hypothetical protein [Rhodospirillaceae bacterium]